MCGVTGNLQEAGQLKGGPPVTYGLSRRLDSWGVVGWREGQRDGDLLSGLSLA
jgi:hypothetical protein